MNQDNDPGHPGQFLPNYTSFRVGGDGSLTPIPRSTISVDAGSTPSQALISPSDELMFGADFLGGILRSFAINDAGQLRSRDAQPLPPAVFAETGAPPFPLGLAVHPSRNLLYVGFVTISRIGVYRFRDSGQLKFERTVPDSGNGVCWLTINKQATRLYASNTGDPSISVYDISKNPSHADRDPDAEIRQYRWWLPVCARLDRNVPARRHPAIGADVRPNGKRDSRLQSGARRNAHRGSLVADAIARAQPGPPAGRGGSLTRTD